MSVSCRRSGKGRKSTRNARSGTSASSDVTLYDYANADKPRNNSGRIRKGELLTQQNQVTLMASSKPVAEDLSWFEKDLDDFDVDPAIEDHTEEGDRLTAVTYAGTEEELVAQTAKVISTRGRLKSHQMTVRWNNVGVDYPLDIWFLLSQYVHIEAVGRFASLCRSANLVVHTATFWKHIYYMYHNTEVRLPEQLDLTNVDKFHGLRSRVIRTLFYSYQPLVERCKSLIPFEDEPHLLEGQRCTLCWHQHVKNNLWRFNFRLQKDGCNGNCALSDKPKFIDLINGYNDVYYNPEEGCSLLQVTCHNFISMPPVMGMMLNKVYLTVSQGMRYHKLRLLFDSHMNTVNTRVSHTGTMITLDPVVKLRVFRWWEPGYQHVTE